MADMIVEPPPHSVPVVFTRTLLDWLPWLEPLAIEALTERHTEALVDDARAKSAYFRLLARDPDALKARTLTDTRTSSTIPTLACPARNVSWRLPQHRASTAASTALRSTPASRRPIRSVRAMCSGSWTTGSMPISVSAGTPSSPPRWR